MNRATTLIQLALWACILLFGVAMLYGLNHVPCQQAAKKECWYSWEDGARVKTCLEADEL